MDPTHLLDGQSAVIVVGGTLVGTVLRCGWRDSRTALSAVVALVRPGFDPDKMRAELAHEVEVIRKDGVFRANPRRMRDREFDSATTALLRTRSLDGLVEQHETWRRTRLRKATAAARTLAQAADLAPVFGLAGTLVALSQLKVDSLAHGNFIGAIAMSVLTTLYGLLLAHIVMGPLGRAVERASQAEEEARAQVMDWLARQVAPACPERRHRVTPARHVSAAGAAAQVAAEFEAEDLLAEEAAAFAPPPAADGLAGEPGTPDPREAA